MSRPSLLTHLRDILILPFTVTVVIPYLIHNNRRPILPDHVGLKLVGAIIFIAGISLFGYTVFLFRNFGQGTLAPWQPTQKLIVKGPYRYCRNPMITGVLSVLLGESLMFHSTPILQWAGLFFLINIVYFVLLEEPMLADRFGDAYLKYKKNVPRWIPRLKPYRDME